MNEKKALGSRATSAEVLCCSLWWPPVLCMLCAAPGPRRGEGEGEAVGVAIAAGAARNLSHYLFLWISRAAAPGILRARPPAFSELQR